MKTWQQDISRTSCKTRRWEKCNHLSHINVIYIYIYDTDTQVLSCFWWQILEETVVSLTLWPLGSTGWFWFYPFNPIFGLKQFCLFNCSLCSPTVENECEQTKANSEVENLVKTPIITTRIPRGFVTIINILPSKYGHVIHWYYRWRSYESNNLDDGKQSTKVTWTNRQSLSLFFFFALSYHDVDCTM